MNLLYYSLLVEKELERLKNLLFAKFNFKNKINHSQRKCLFNYCDNHDYHAIHTGVFNEFYRSIMVGEQ